MKFTEKFYGIKEKNSILCIGLDPDPSLIPPSVLAEKNPILKFCRELVDATSDLVCGYKLNTAFFEASSGFDTMAEVREYINDALITIADAKRGDIGNTARMYAKAFFDNIGFDAITLSPYMGYDAIEPFASYKDKMSFILCLTSNPGSKDFEELLVQENTDTDLSVQPLWKSVARKVNEWNKNDNLGLVVGATKPDALQTIREITNIPLLVPGIGKQGGDIRNIIGYGGIVIPTVSRSIIYASRDKDFAEAARKKTEEFVSMLP
ncbi:MAG: orotidine-5'-phosphate decarboxylase [bacterium (Candidatus Stahlbacteria) CG08_land_8_20_14_0_20_40_26]|nr:MAG: orotidine-5'-phosphate decarboxylase [bacterium (Candidatus Stahlbacteria) CG23_combo_of_CG06-09_8_20_14_all_40_9]PIS24907.1 MAG: orotidine-5'-phosphate decarboxylase [bacterium (Candidatus Stahlbacteria) CG08_land_8_20_14_0_20_40_26]